MTKTEWLIYPPPKKALPFLVVTIAASGVSVLPVNSRLEARTIVGRATRSPTRRDEPERPKPE